MALTNAATTRPIGGFSASPRTNLGEILVEVGVISQEQLNQALAAAGGSERDLGKWLVDLSFTTEEKIMKGIGIKAKVPYFISLEGLYSPDSGAIVSEELARRLQVVPLFKIENVATVAMVNPLDVFTIDALIKTTGYRIDPVVCMRSTIFETINKLYGGWEGNQLPGFTRTVETAQPSGPANSSSLVIEYSPSLGPKGPAALPAVSASLPPPPSPATVSISAIPKKAVETDLNKIVQDLKGKFASDQKHFQLDIIQKDIQRASEEMPIVQLVDGIFRQAVTKKASDIHIEPLSDQTEVRFRIDGVMRPAMTVPKEFESAMVARIKVMANLDITENRQPQDGRVLTEVGERPIDLRISTLPTIHGEKTVIRILDKGAIEFKLANLGFNKASEDVFTDTIERPNGIILVTGPTGSGKSTTLYTALGLLNSPERNIVTLEDPVEYQLAHINQVQVNPKVGLTFAKGLRSILRQDPDVIMVGEIRDQETAEIAIQSALTGHLVLSTLHTNDAPSAITRLINMKVEPFLISASVLLIIAQRLVRVLCKECKEPYEPPVAMVQKLREAAGVQGPVTFYKPKGCDVCHQTGFKGRKGVYEILKMTSHLRDLTISDNTLDSIRQAAREQGMRSLYEEGATQVLAGNTTIEEMLRVCKQDE